MPVLSVARRQFLKASTLPRQIAEGHSAPDAAAGETRPLQRYLGKLPRDIAWAPAPSPTNFVLQRYLGKLPRDIMVRQVVAGDDVVASTLPRQIAEGHCPTPWWPPSRPTCFNVTSANCRGTSRSRRSRRGRSGRFNVTSANCRGTSTPSYDVVPAAKNCAFSSTLPNFPRDPHIGRLHAF